MIEIVPFAALGRFENEWLEARYHFSFASYRDPKRMGFGPLRVWNDDRVKPGAGFEMHGHRDMEIITYMRRGAITHRDDLGNEGRITAGEVQVMSAGTGIVHSEKNEGVEPAELFQIWILPRAQGLKPRWDQRRVTAHGRPGTLVTLASGRGDPDALAINQDAAVLAAVLPKGSAVSHPLPGRRAYLATTHGRIDVNGIPSGPRDGVAAMRVSALDIRAEDDAEIVLVDLPDA
jgi:redox-sensitive bicupin YhaK (pirin superfamily)